ncbi:MBL fold metallo-hydrolase [Ideonella sp. A 288]|uniref:MBL fold metallo-hydrolase n=1 Tax=Ideonella sp. A 288 TaxID=1962181 RepID=UPI000B4B59EA|nr:MBL fold metallo-hydrolase [Ideonella sp. A 288]
MRVRFLGAVGVVTGSCTWLRDEARGWSFLVDCGLNLDGGRVPHWTDGPWPFEPSRIQFVALTHAHLDHCGLIPLLYKHGFKGPVYCTTETALIAQKVLEEAARQPDVGYTAREVASIAWRPFRGDLPLGQPRPVATDLFLRAYRSGHIVGAVSLAVLWGSPGPNQRSIVFSGDVGPGCEDDEVTPLIRFPWRPAPANFAVLESTYGNLVRSSEQRNPAVRLASLEALIERTVALKGTLLMPAFALGRVQDMLFDLHAIVAKAPHRFGNLKVLLDAPLASRIQPIVAKALGDSEVTGKTGKVRLRWLGKQVFRLLGLDDTDPDDIDAAIAICQQTLTANRGVDLPAVTRGNEIARNWRPLVQSLKDLGLSRDAQPEGPTVIVCGSADGENGAAAQWLPTLIRNSLTIVASTGYTPGGSVMTRLMALVATSPHERRRHTGSIEWANGKAVRVRDIAADLVRLSGYSAHADQQDLVNWVFHRHGDREVRSAPVVFIQHGEDLQRGKLAEVLQERAAGLCHELTVIQPRPCNLEAWHSLEAETTLPIECDTRGVATLAR